MSKNLITKTKRKEGEFYTPAIWVDKAHEYIASVYGDDWKEKYVVWDPAWGTGNLTCDYNFKELYVSTLHQSDIDEGNEMGNNPEAVKFQYDFLNDDYDKLPEGLRKAIEEGRKIIVLMNPPYVSATSTRSFDDKTSALTETKINIRMKQDKLGRASSNYYLQFIYRAINDFNNVDLCLFVPPTFLSGVTCKNFRKVLFKLMEFKTGFLMNAKYFEGLKSWPISFAIFKKKI